MKPELRLLLMIARHITGLKAYQPEITDLAEKIEADFLTSRVPFDTIRGAEETSRIVSLACEAAANKQRSRDIAIIDKCASLCGVAEQQFAREVIARIRSGE